MIGHGQFITLLYAITPVFRHPTPMAEDRNLSLPRLHKIALPHVNIDVNDLKELIHTKGIDTRKSTVLAKDLILWRF